MMQRLASDADVAQSLRQEQLIKAPGAPGKRAVKSSSMRKSRIPATDLCCHGGGPLPSVVRAARATAPAAFFLACLAALELEGYGWRSYSGFRPISNLVGSRLPLKNLTKIFPFVALPIASAMYCMFGSLETSMTPS